VKAAILPLFTDGQMPDAWYANIAETDDQAIVLRDADR